MAAHKTRTLANRQYLTRPELSVLLAHARIDLSDEFPARICTPTALAQSTDYEECLGCR
jgi:hypothetical protein